MPKLVSQKTATSSPKDNSQNSAKTGCWTCQERGEECGETTDACRNCSRDGFVCELTKPSHLSDPVKIETEYAPKLPTDSGYASAPPQQIPALPDVDPEAAAFESAHCGETQFRDGADTMDSQTEYSAATAIAPVRSQVYVSEFCQEVYGNLRSHLAVAGKDSWPAFFEILPELLKAFAIKIGQQNSREHRSTMQFVYVRAQ